MGAAYQRARKPGTGSVRYRFGTWWAHEARGPGQKWGRTIGKFDTSFRAHQAADKWYAEQRSNVA